MVLPANLSVGRSAQGFSGPLHPSSHWLSRGGCYSWGRVFRGADSRAFTSFGSRPRCGAPALGRPFVPRCSLCPRTPQCFHLAAPTAASSRPAAVFPSHQAGLCFRLAPALASATFVWPQISLGPSQPRGISLPPWEQLAEGLRLGGCHPDQTPYDACQQAPGPPCLLRSGDPGILVCMSVSVRACELRIRGMVCTFIFVRQGLMCPGARPSAGHFPRWGPSPAQPPDSFHSGLWPLCPLRPLLPGGFWAWPVARPVWGPLYPQGGSEWVAVGRHADVQTCAGRCCCPVLCGLRPPGERAWQAFLLRGLLTAPEPAQACSGPASLGMRW